MHFLLIIITENLKNLFTEIKMKNINNIDSAYINFIINIKYTNFYINIILLS